MSNPIVDSIVADIEAQILPAAKEAGIQAAESFVQDAKSFLLTEVQALTRWVEGFMSGSFSKEDLKNLLGDLIQDAMIHGLTILEKAGVAVDNTGSTLLKIASSIAGNAIGKLV